MAFVDPITIKDIVDNIHRRHYLLPSIQREFVWGVDQIELLFDSLMRDYPINSFLFWEVEDENIQNYQFYEFLREYHERDNRHNIKANLKGQKNIIAILDGQQRLTSLYIGLKGTYSYKLPHKKWNNDLAFPKRKLYLNILKKSEDYERIFDFQFLTDEEAMENDEDHYWFLIGDILNFTHLSDILEFITNFAGKYTGELSKFASNTLTQLFQIIHLNKSINFFLEKGESLDKVLNIFIRVNSGGTILSYSDLLLSIASAQWKEKDAREEIMSFVDEINASGNGFNIDKDFVLKSCLVLSDINDIAFRVDNFNKDNMRIIEKNWDNITESIRSSYNLLNSLGYSRETLTSNNATIPIAYYLYQKNNPINFHIAARYEENRKNISLWLALVLLKRTFSGQPDNVLRLVREIIKKEDNLFPLDTIIDKLKGTPKSLSFSDDEIDNLFWHEYGKSYTFSILALLYPTLDYRNKFHEDHIFPKTLFTEKKLLKSGIVEGKIEFYLGNYNCLANLQLLEGIPNQEKSKTPFDVWIKEKYPKLIDRKVYMERNYIPDINFDLNNFEEFISRRTQLIKNSLKKTLRIK
jgi:uncharacterized protein with ParB-like and HNH nuclease domain